MATLFVDNLTVLDFSYLHAKRGMVGESWIVDLELTGDLDDMGMVLDFGRIKKAVKQALDEEVDHKLVVPDDSDCLSRLPAEGSVNLDWAYQGGVIRMKAPTCSTVFIPGTEVTKSSVTLYLMEVLYRILPANVSELVLTLREEDTGTFPSYHYSHGLKKHDGNCQRIAHGHRSRIEIFENGRRSRYWEKLWADRWEDIYIGSEEDLEGTYFIDEVPHHRFRYEAPQGLFELVIPEDHCYLIPTDSTVEYLAAHIAAELADEALGKHFRVRAFEGVGKGALAEAGTMRA
ncbi:6-pyruvoyl trahydropterin synthase family protein [Isoalcanivorax indicus]|uniref:6-pyruvoyl trahydropterin synthase family protein n=1 Tax=Isoalcanivorax indicus TaxID=2202653 RepID=UPI000DBA37E3|nr:6-carboxytetrahydropterin synthase [Isoalcanivorax indicus]